MSRLADLVRERCVIVAEAGQNHNGSMERARLLIDAAVDAGCDYVKGQKRDVDSMPAEQLDRPYDNEFSYGATYREHRKHLEFTIEQHAELEAYAASKGIGYTVSVWDRKSTDEAVAAGFEWLKTPSAIATDTPLLEHIASTGLPVVYSTGATTLEQVDAGVSALSRAPELYVLQANSTYPAPPHELDLHVMRTYEARYGCPVGFSGHHLGISIDCFAVAMGARIVERHITLNRADRGRDHAASLEPGGLKKLVRDIREGEAAMGTPRKRVYAGEVEVMKRLRGSP